MGESEKRKFLRYNVANHPTLKGRIDKGRMSTEQLITLAVGGCGFYGLDETVALRAGKRVISIFEMTEVLPEPVEVQGNIVYATPISINGRNVIFYGVEFLDQFREYVQPLIQELEKQQKSSGSGK